MLIGSLMGAGLCKGIYDANIFASLFDVVRPEDRGTAAGLMNTVGWTGGFVAPTAVGLASEHFGLSVAIASTAVVYFLVGLLALSGRAPGRARCIREVLTSPLGSSCPIISMIHRTFEKRHLGLSSPGPPVL